MKKVSILICCHSQDDKHDKLLERALESLTRQTFDDFEVVLVLDESWEFTRGVAEHYYDVLDLRIFERPTKQGLAAAKNYGIKHCKGEWIAYLDADDAYHEEKLERQIEFLKINPDIDFLFCQAYDVYNVGEDNEEVTDNCFKLGEFETHEQIINELSHQNCLHHGTALIRKSALQNLGGYSISSIFKGREDYEMWCRAINLGYKFSNLPFRGYYYSMGTSVER